MPLIVNLALIHQFDVNHEPDPDFCEAGFGCRLMKICPLLNPDF
jgi:hypothetical protein